jgi:hypothetical protein
MRASTANRALHGFGASIVPPEGPPFRSQIDWNVNGRFIQRILEFGFAGNPSRFKKEGGKMADESLAGDVDLKAGTISGSKFQIDFAIRWE